MRKNDRIFRASKILALGICTAAACAGTISTLRADPVSPVGWTSNIPLGTPLPEGLYFIDVGYGMDRSGPNMAPGFHEIQAAVNIPVLAWSTPAMLLGARLEVIVFTAEAQVGANLTSGSQLTAADIYNPAGLVGLVWNLGGGWSFGDHIGGFTPMDNDLGKLGLGGNFWTFANVAALDWAGGDGWSLMANLIYLHSGTDLTTGVQDQPDTLDVDFSAVKHIGEWEVGLVGSATTDLTNAYRNNYGITPMHQITLGGLFGKTWGKTVTTELIVTRTVYAQNQDGGGYDTRVWGKITVPMWNPPPPPAPSLAKY